MFSFAAPTHQGFVTARVDAAARARHSTGGLATLDDVVRQTELQTERRKRIEERRKRPLAERVAEARDAREREIQRQMKRGEAMINLASCLFADTYCTQWLVVAI